METAIQRMPDESRKAAVLLENARVHIFPGPSTLATLGGQRQLAVWLTDGVACLTDLRSAPSFTALMDPALPDDPEAFLPVLNDLMTDASRLLKDGIWDDMAQWAAAEPETLVNGWFALSMLSRVSSEPELFELSADAMADYINSRKDVTEWLRKAVEG